METSGDTMLSEKDTPLRLVRYYAKLFPDIYNTLDKLRDTKNSYEITWPDFCYLPIGAAHTTIVFQYGLNNIQAAEFSAGITGCYIWRKSSRVIYDFDLDFAQILASQASELNETDVLPTDLLIHLPYDCIYIKCPGLYEYVDGFFTWIEYDIERNETELRIQFVTFNFSYSVPCVLHLDGKTIGECIEATNNAISRNNEIHLRETGKELPNDMRATNTDEIQMILSAIQLLLYLVSSNAEIVEAPKLQRRSKYNKPIKKDDNKDKASNIIHNQVGIRIGSTIRKSRQYNHNSKSTGTGPQKRPHSRRGHWHHYWTGSNKYNNRKLILKWTAPTFIHADDIDGDIIIHKVK